MSNRNRRSRRSKWDDPVSPLQAARFEHRWNQMDVCLRVREVCPGHGEGKPCRMEPSKLSEYERGQRDPSMKHVLALGIVFAKSPAELGLLHRPGMPNGAENSSATNQTATGYANPSEARQSPEGGKPRGPLDDLLLSVLLRVLLGEGGSGSMRRDDFIKGVGAAAGAAVVDPFVALSRRAQDEINHTKISNEQVERLTRAVYRHARNYYQLNDQERLASLLHDWTSTQRLLELPATHAQRTKLLNVYARLSGILGQFATGRLENHRALALLEAALDAARASGDADLVGWVHWRFCVIANRNNAFDEVVEWASGGLQAVGSSRTTTAASLHGWLGRGYAGMGDRRASRTHLETAERTLGNALVGCWFMTPEMPRAFTFDEAELRRTMAMAHLRVADYTTVYENCDRADAIFSKLGLSPRTVTSVMGSRMTRSEALLRDGELEGAVQIATAALREYEGVAVPVQLDRARRMERALTAVDTSGTYARQFSEFLRSRAA